MTRSAFNRQGNRTVYRCSFQNSECLCVQLIEPSSLSFGRELEETFLRVPCQVLLFGGTPKDGVDRPRERIGIAGSNKNA
jgi:hypothetical protein